MRCTPPAAGTWRQLLLAFRAAKALAASMAAVSLPAFIPQLRPAPLCLASLCPVFAEEEVRVEESLHRRFAPGERGEGSSSRGNECRKGVSAAGERGKKACGTPGGRVGERWRLSKYAEGGVQYGEGHGERRWMKSPLKHLQELLYYVSQI